MKNILFLLLFFRLFVSAAQTTDSIDNIVLTIPSEWKINKQTSFTGLTLFDKNIKSFCQLAIYQQQPSTANKQKDFEREWKELVEKNFTVLTIIKPVPEKDKKGNSFLRYGAKGVGSDGNKYFVQLNMYDCGASVQTVMATSGSKESLVKYDSLWQAVIIKVKKTTAAPMQPATEKINNPNSTNTTTDKRLMGKWAKSSSSPPEYINGVLVNLVNAGYQKGQYDFKADGTYTFHGESKFSTNHYNLTDEKGSYTVSDNQLILMPSTAGLRQIDFNGNLKKSESLSLAKRDYSWQLHFFEGINETNLVLSAVAENIVDGGYGGNSLFPNSFLYSQKFIPEWRFHP